MQVVSRPPEHKKWLLLLAGAGMLAASSLIGLGLFVFIISGNTLSLAAATPTFTITTPHRAFFYCFR